MLKYRPKQIKEALDNYDKMKSFRKVEMQLGISKSTVHRWWTKFHTLSLRQRIQKHKKYKTKRMSKYKHLDFYIKELFSNLDTVKYFTLSQIQTVIEKLYRKKPSLQWISKSLKKNKISKHKFRKNHVCTRSQDEILHMTKKFHDELKSIDNEKIISIDETSFCNIGVSKDGYFMKGKYPFTMQTKKRETLSLVMAVTNHNIISFSLQNGAFNSYSFFNFVKNLLDQILNDQKYVFIMDNVSFHKSKKIIDLVHSKGHRIVFIPPYSPQCNPIEEVFSELKRKYRSCDNPSFIDKIKTSITQINQSNLKGYGNGGKGMNNLKGTQAAPNVKIKRHLESYFKVFSQDEHFTSKTCPCCKGRCLHSFTKKKGENEFKKHHLLRCTNVDCKSRWWNRNVVGSFNILKKFLDEKSNIEYPTT